MATPNANEQDKYPELTNSIAARMLMSDPKLALEPEKVFEQARKVSDVLGPQGFTGVDRITNLPGSVTVYQQGDRTSQLTFDDAKKIVETSIEQGNVSAPQPGGATATDTAPSSPPAQANNTTTLQVDAQAPAPAGTVPVTPAPATTDGTPAPQSLTFGGLNVSPQDLKVRFGDFSGAVTPTTLNPDQGSNELRFTYNNPDPNSVFRRADVFSNFTTNPVAVNDINASTQFQFSPNFQLNAGIGYDLKTSTPNATIGYNSNDGVPAQGNNPALAPSTSASLTIGNGINANVVAPINGREGTLTSSLNITPGAATPDTLSANYVSNDGRPASADGKTPAVPPSTQIGATLTNAQEGLGINANVVAPINGREGTLTSTLNITPGAATPDTLSANYVSNDGRPASADGKTPAVPSSTQIGATLTNAQEGLGINANVVAPINGREGTLTSNLNITPGANVADTASVAYSQTNDKYNSWRVGADYSTGTPGVNGENTSPAGLNVSGAYNVGNQALNYGVNATAGRDNMIGGFVNAETPTLQASAQAKYNLNTNEGQVTGRVAYTPSSDVSVYGSLSAKTNGETVAALGVNIGNPNQAAPQFNAAQQRQQLDSNVVDYKIAQLEGNDRKLYDQALAGVNKLNEGGANLPARETALSLTALADSQKPPLSQIGDVRLGPAGADGSQKLYVGNGALDNPATRSVSMERNEAANTPAEQSLAKLSENNLIQSLQNRNNPQQSLDNLVQNQPSRAVASR